MLLSVANHSLAIALGLCFVLPFVFVILTSLMPASQVFSSRLWPQPFRWSNYAGVFKLFDVWLFTANTIKYAVLSTVGVVVSSVPVAYALSRMRWRGRQVAFVLVLATLMLPAQVTIVPLYVIFVRLHWIGWLVVLVLVLLSFLPLVQILADYFNGRYDVAGAGRRLCGRPERRRCAASGWGRRWKCPASGRRRRRCR